MKKNLSFIVIALLAFGACSKKSSNSSTANDPYNGQPQNYPPDINWGGQGSNFVPQGNCGQSQQMPSGCSGSYNGYSYCGNQWYMEYNSIVWAFPSTAGGCGSHNNNSGDNWWDDYNNNDNSHDDSWDDNDDNNSGSGSGSSSSNYNKWVGVWSKMASSEDRSIVISPPSDGTYYISFKGQYSGKSQKDEVLKVKFKDGNSHKIKDLDNSSSSDTTKTCKVNVNFKLQGGKSYRIYLSGDDDSVNSTYLRITKSWPSDVTTLCD